ncbi:DUF6421 family protein [Cytobacillus oceanisediminis]|uniref:DUF6421 family protein n=1 Tax=Cytobacillus oceanisediminis TaxID=665099 RepID=UPI001C235DC1|nr:DUF6421 family protein [Cytobacillus oceanisediminis]MBU8772102.1 hypothetical protein [Cytobacillus oceanisediminis]
MALLHKADLSQYTWHKDVTNIIQSVNTIRKKQRKDGSTLDIKRSSAEIEKVIKRLHSIKKHFNPEYINAVIVDLRKWIEKGLDTVPDFSSSFNKYSQETNKSFGLILFPIYDLTYLTKDIFLEVCVYYRNEPPIIDYLRENMDHKVFQGTELLMATDGITHNNVFTLFPENIAIEKLKDQKKFAFFFISNYLKIFKNITKPLGSFAVSTPLNIFNATDEEVYNSRCVFSFVHDFYHYKGILPFNEFYSDKTTLFGSAFEEIRVEAQTYLKLISFNNNMTKMASELLLLERVYRYAYTNNPGESFDTLTNYYFFKFFLKSGAITLDQMSISFDFDKVKSSFVSIVSELDQLEKKILCSPGEQFQGIIKNWLKNYLIFEKDDKEVKPILFAEWLIERGQSLGIPRSIVTVKN